MDWLDRLERRFGKFAIKNLIVYIIGLNIAVFLFSMLDTTGGFLQRLMLEPSLIMKGEIWRLFTYIFIPPTFSPIWLFFALYFFYLIGNSLEQEWGSFKFNIYYLLGMIGTTIGAFISGGGSTAFYLNTSLFLAFAYIYPDYEILLFFILPVKVKYLAWIDWALILYTIIFSPLPMKIAAITSVINYIVFFGADIVSGLRGRKKSYKRKKRYLKEVYRREYIHKCTVCGITEKENPNMEFRYCSKCDGDHEYCMDHLYNHEHIKNKQE